MSCKRLLGFFSLAVLMATAGCGGLPTQPVGFVNHTQHSDAQLWAVWTTAQQSLSEQIDLNPLQQQRTNAAPVILPGDARALNIKPRQLVVSSAPDVSAAVLYQATGTTRGNPTGLILCPQPCNVDYVPAYSLYAPATSRYAASWEFSGDNFDLLMQYEFENQILKALGYDMTWR